jgi:hypothetical protein
MEVRLKPFVKGAASVVIPPLGRVSKFNRMSAVNPDFCYSIFLRHYSHAAPYSRSLMPEVVAELAPGGSLGLGFCALMFGTKIYYALDFVDHTGTTRNLGVFNALVEMFRERRPVPRHEGTFPEPADWGFPDGFFMPNDDGIEAPANPSVRMIGKNSPALALSSWTTGVCFKYAPRSARR